MTDTQPAEKPNYKKTLNLMKTAFPMKANLIQNEPASLKRWSRSGLYRSLREARAGAEKFRFHDGPPYANGSIHHGHLMNKCLKDFVVRSRSMEGLDVAYVPGWDCHGLPIEHKVMTELHESGRAAELNALEGSAARLAIRRACKKHAEKYVKLQSGQFQRLLTLADYDDPYLTMTPGYEAAVLEVLAGLLDGGLVYRALKPVHWSIANETALAEAELEYMDREDLSVYVDFEAVDASAVYAAFGIDEAERERLELGATPSFMIWTTTPWTLPANEAIAVHERFEYVLAKIDGNFTVLAAELLGPVTEAAKSEDVEVVARAPGAGLVGLKYRHPFRDIPALATAAVWTIVSADYVTLEDGTGLVHTAPGHGTEDFQTGQRVGLPVYCPVRGDGTFDESVPEWLAGVSIWDANETITERLRESGHLFYAHRFDHSYPHDWRSKTPVIFRCTEQWFVGVDLEFGGGASLRDRALGVIGEEGRLGFVPAWGRNRLRGMLENRPDWCISRQRSWGLPIPAFVLPDGSTFMTAAVVRAVAAVFGEHGSDAWFKAPPADLLRDYDAASDADAPGSIRDGSVGLGELRTGPDILDVWFESGSSWHAVMRTRFGDDAVPVELYLEGSDQHRGWFQTSMLPGIGLTGLPPYKKVLTHGFCVDIEGKKLSKSSGHTIEDLFDTYGADVLRWWVSSVAYEGDVKVDDELFKVAGESYRKIRNTIRFLLGNLYDFDAAADAVDLSGIEPTSLEAWALADLDRLTADVRRAYEAYDFRSAHQAIYDFCNDAMSATFLAATKDRLYCDRPDSARRRRTQTAMHRIADQLCRLVAPVLCHTADEAWRHLHGVEGDESVHAACYLEPAGVEVDHGWERALEARDAALKALEVAKAERGIENPLDAGLVLPDHGGALSRFDAEDLADLCGVSRASIGAVDAVEVQDLRDEPRCERSRKRHETVRARSDGGLLCDRDAEAVGVG